MKTILVPTDGSAAADKALNLALDLAQVHGADIKLLHVLLRDKDADELLRLPELAAEKNLVGALQELAAGPKTPHSAEELMADPNLPERPAPDAVLHMIANSVLARASALARARGAAVEILAVADGAAAPAIAAAARTVTADMVVMGMRGLRPSEAFTFGSVSQEVCERAECTCVAVH